MKKKYTNQLINSTSPYLLQHAHNPVNWFPWDEKVFDLAKQQNKLILISVGYAACHWCHVMAHESFEDEHVATVMNENYVCVKIDKEERPDIDHYYMTAIHLMGQRGGWPLNVVALPDGRPIWGGTYFPKNTWIKNLVAIAEYYRQNSPETEKYAQNLQDGIEQSMLSFNNDNSESFQVGKIEETVEKWKQLFDMKNGGQKGAPKFPMPVNLDFLMYYGKIKPDEAVLQFVNTTLLKMARGGIYDQVGGGFARYSVDNEWKVPHFEKMLYDNGQLISVYSKAFQLFKNPEFKSVIYETVMFIEHEMRDSSGAFYSSLDADSEGEEGKYYVWDEQRLKGLQLPDYMLFAEYYNIGKKGYWEKGNNVLLRDASDEDFAKRYNIDLKELNNKIQKWKNILLIERNKRVRPGLDDKTLVSWNAIVIQGLIDAAVATNDNYFLEMGLSCARFIRDKVIQADGKLFHLWKGGKLSVDGFLDDYSFTIQSFISLFEITGDKAWLDLSVKLTEYTINNFLDRKNNMFYYVEKGSATCVSNHFQTEDNVVPSANSVMAANLHKLYLAYGDKSFHTITKKMAGALTAQFFKYPMAFANWGTLLLKLNFPYHEVAVVGKNAPKIIMDLKNGYRPNIFWFFSENNSDIPLLKERYYPEKTLIYVCQEGTCQLPVEEVGHVLKLLG